jgi:spermidine/putrescine transport system substrate-binding protein
MRHLFVLCLALLAGLTARAAKPGLNLFIWSEYIDPTVVADFEQQADCKVVIDLYEDEAAMMAKLQSGGGALYDVVVPPQNKVPALIKLGLLAPLRHERLPHRKNLEDRFRDPPYDRGNKYSVPYHWGTMGLFVRRTPGQPLPDSWGFLFDPRQQPGAFVLIDSARDLLGAALKFRGHGFNSTDPAQIKEARDLILAAKARSLAFDGSVGARTKVLAKSARAAIVYSPEGARGMAEDPDTAYVIPREGSQIWQDNLVILARAPHRDLAERFIDFLLVGEVAARNARYTKGATPNQAAQALLTAEERLNPAIHPPEDVKAKLEFLDDLGAKSRLYDEAWTQIKAR